MRLKEHSTDFEICTLPGFAMSGPDVNQEYIFDVREFTYSADELDALWSAEIEGMTSELNELDAIELEAITHSPISTAEQKADAYQALRDLRQVEGYEDMRDWEELK